MQRRNFLKAALATSAASLATATQAQAPVSGSREYYQFRKYSLRSGPQIKLTDQFFSTALIPALNRLGMSPIGAFKVDFGPQTPTYYLLIPGSSLEKLVDVDLLLAEDKEFLKLAEPFWSAPAKEPPFDRIESTLLKDACALADEILTTPFNTIFKYNNRRSRVWTHDCLLSD